MIATEVTSRTAGPSEVVLIPAAVMATIRAAAEAAYPEECCGALFGVSYPPAPVSPAAPSAPSTVRELVRAVPLANEWEGGREARYLIPASVVRELESEARGSGLELVGFFHSHPGGVAVPSTFDLEVAWPWYSYLIVATGPRVDGVAGIGAAGGSAAGASADGASAAGASAAGTVRGWRLRDDRSGFMEQVLLEPGTGQEEFLLGSEAGEEEICGL